jgi:hypothetical protein
MKEPSFSRCGVCGVEIAEGDFEKGRAVRVLGKDYCPKCMAETIERSKVPGAPPEFRTPLPRPPERRPDRRRHERRSVPMTLEVSVYLSGRLLYTRGGAQLENVSLSGALLGSCLFPDRPLPKPPYTIGMRFLEGEARGLELVGRPLRIAESPSGMSIALHFQGMSEKDRSALGRIL